MGAAAERGIKTQKLKRGSQADAIPQRIEVKNRAEVDVTANEAKHEKKHFLSRG